MKERKQALKPEMKISLADAGSGHRHNLSVRLLLTPDEVSRLTRLSKDTLAQWRSQKRGISYLKVGRRVRYDPADVDAYLEGCRVSVSDPQERRQR